MSITVADTLGAKRPDLVTERRSMNLNYGDLFLAHHLVKSGAKMEDIAAQLKAGKKIEPDRQRSARRLEADCRRRQEAEFQDGGQPLQALPERQATDAIATRQKTTIPNIDGVTADNDVSKDDIAEAEQTYLTLAGSRREKKGSSLDASTEKAAQAPAAIRCAPKPDSLTPPK